MSYPYPIVELSAVVICLKDGRVLLDYNDRWGAFTLPMSKRHSLPPAVEHGQPTTESAEMAGMRAASEVLGHPLLKGSLREMPLELEPYHQSGSDGQWKRYTFTVFTTTTEELPKPLPGHTAIWIDPKAIEQVDPISPTARLILKNM